MFEKITKGQFHLPHLADNNTTCDCGYMFVDENGKCVTMVYSGGNSNIMQEYPTSEEAKANAEFITYCFNLQQKFDIGMLEELVSVAHKCGYSMHGSQEEAESFYGIREILKVIRKS